MEIVSLVAQAVDRAKALISSKSIREIDKGSKASEKKSKCGSKVSKLIKKKSSKVKKDKKGKKKKAKKINGCCAHRCFSHLGRLINETEEKIQYIKYRPVQPFDSKSPVNFTIPGNSSQYVSLRDSYLFVECHMEKTDALGNRTFIMIDQPQPSRKRTAEEAFGPTTPEKNRKKRIANGQRSNEGEKEGEKEEEEAMMASGGAPACVTTRAQLAKLLEEAETKYAEAQTAYANAEAQKADKAKYDDAIAVAETVEDMAVQQMKHYVMAKRRLKFLYNLDGYVVPVDNILHTLWNRVDIIMNQELVSTTNQKYMYKAYIESVLNNSASTKKFQLETQGFYGDQGDKD